MVAEDSILRGNSPASYKHIPVAGEVLRHGGNPSDQVPREGTRVSGIPSFNRPRRADVGVVRPPVSDGSTHPRDLNWSVPNTITKPLQGEQEPSLGAPIA